MDPTKSFILLITEWITASLKWEDYWHLFRKKVPFFFITNYILLSTVPVIWSTLYLFYFLWKVSHSLFLILFMWKISLPIHSQEIWYKWFFSAVFPTKLHRQRKFKDTKDIYLLLMVLWIYDFPRGVVSLIYHWWYPKDPCQDKILPPI